MRLRHFFVVPIIDVTWFSQFIDELEREAKSFQFDEQGHMSPQTNLRLTSGKHATPGAEYEITEISPTGVSKSALAINEWSGNRIEVTTTSDAQVAKTSARRDVKNGLHDVNVQLTGSGMRVDGQIDVRKFFEANGEFATCRLTHKFGVGDIDAQCRATEDGWRIDVALQVRGRGLMRPVLFLGLLPMRLKMQKWFVRQINRFASESVAKLHEQLQRDPKDAARDAVQLWLTT